MPATHLRPIDEFDPNAHPHHVDMPVSSRIQRRIAEWLSTDEARGSFGFDLIRPEGHRGYRVVYMFSDLPTAVAMKMKFV